MSHTPVQLVVPTAAGNGIGRRGLSGGVSVGFPNSDIAGGGTYVPVCAFERENGVTVFGEARPCGRRDPGM